MHQSKCQYCQIGYYPPDRQYARNVICLKKQISNTTSTNMNISPTTPIRNSISWATIFLAVAASSPETNSLESIRSPLVAPRTIMSTYANAATFAAIGCDFFFAVRVNRLNSPNHNNAGHTQN